MKVVHLSTSDVRGGAARGAYFLHRRLRATGIDSTMLVGRKYSDDTSVRQVAAVAAPIAERLRGNLDALPLKTYDKTADSFWTVGWQPRDLVRRLERFAPDVVHVQWTGGGFMPPDALAGLSVPIVWTLRDMWAFTGGCHYTAGCEGYKHFCGACPQLRSSKSFDLSRKTAGRKRHALVRQPIHFVPISEWMADRCRESAVLRNRSVTVIPNGIDCTTFRPETRVVARRRLGLPENRRYILFAALNPLDDERKGFRKLAEALAHMPSRQDDDPPELLVVGDLSASNAPNLPVPVRLLGRVDDETRLATLYSAADVTAAPSLQEAFGKVHAESMACGTPAVAFDSGGPAEIIRHKETGYLAKAFDPKDLGAGLEWCLGEMGRSAALGKKCRERACRHYDIGVIAERYSDLYATLTKEAAA